MRDNDNKSIYLAIFLCIAVVFLPDYFFKNDEPIEEAAPTTVAEDIEEEAVVKVEEPAIPVKQALSQDSRIEILNNDLKGSIRIKGARLDNLYLTKYKQTLDEDSDFVELLAPAKTDNPYFAEFGWTSTDPEVRVPNRNTMWRVIGDKLTPNSPVIFEWDNGQGLTFIRKISLDNNYLFTIEQTVTNDSGKDITLYPYGLINKVQEGSASRSTVHEGAVAVINKTLKEEKLKSIKDDKKIEFESKGGWAGFTERYWFTSLIFNNDVENAVKFLNTSDNTFQIDYVGEGVQIKSNNAGSNKIRFFAGAKEIKLIDKYAKTQNITKFDLNIDFGWYYFLTKPFFYILDFLYHIIGNMGWAILLFAALLRLVMYPIASKSYESMSKMKKVQPKIKEIQERYKDNKQLLQQETMNLYRKEKINPASGCLPLLIQIPVFFSLYKVLNIAIEIRHAPFIGWIKDLSAPDPLTLSVLLHFPVPGLINIGVWPIVMGLTMWVQQKLNPAPVNKDQARIFAMMPVIFTFMMGHFASGLVIYWTLTNILSIVQQKAIMRKNGVQ